MFFYFYVMTIKELIEQLQQLDPETHVFVKGYEGGLEYAELKGSVMDVALDVNSDDEWWYGKHDCATDNHRNDSNITIVKGIVL